MDSWQVVKTPSPPLAESASAAVREASDDLQMAPFQQKQFACTFVTFSGLR